MRPYVIVLAFLLIGCPGGETVDVSKSGPTQSTPSTAPVVNPTDNTAAVNPVVPVNTQPGAVQKTATPATADIHLIEYAVHLPQTLTAGSQTFQVENGGKETHSLQIEGNGTSVKLPADLPRGERATLTVDLKPGSYTFYCPIKGHKEKGMTTAVTVK